MNPAAHLPALELRVLRGEQAGARAELTRGGACRVAGGAVAGGSGALAEPPDVVLRCAVGFVLRMSVPDAAGEVMLTVLEGTAHLGDVELPAGEARAWRLGAPLRLGDVVLAIGPRDQEHWAPPAEAPAEPPAPPETPPAAAAPRRSLERLLLALGAGLVVASAGLLGVVELLSPAQAAAGSPQAVAAALKASEFKQLTLDRTAQGGWRLSGRLGSAAERERLDAWLARQQITAELHVRVDDQLAAEVTDVFRLHGLTVKAETTGEGTVQVRAQERDTWRLTQAEQAARRDLPGLRGLQVNNQPPAAAASPRPPLSPDAGKRIVSVVGDAESPYFVTADGSRYFVGAMLPSGHRVMQIADNAVMVERDGLLTRLTL